MSNLLTAWFVAVALIVMPSTRAEAGQTRKILLIATTGDAGSAAATRQLYGALSASLADAGWETVAPDQLGDVDEKKLERALKGKKEAVLEVALLAGTSHALVCSLNSERREIKPVGVTMTMISAELSGKVYEVLSGSQLLAFNLQERSSAPDQLVATKDAFTKLALAVAEHDLFQKKNTEIQVVQRDVRDELAVIPAFNIPANEANAAVVIGVEKYRSLPHSEFSRKDGELVANYLQAMGIPRRNIELLLDDRATRTDIERALEGWLPAHAKKDGTVVVYYSGHGAPDPATGDGYLVPFDGDPNYLGVTGYPLKRLYEKLGALGARKVVVVLDSCFSGAGGRSVLAKGARPLVMTSRSSLPMPDKLRILTSSQGGQISTSSQEKGHGVFTYYFLLALKNGTHDLADIYRFVSPKVEDEAKGQNVEQRPSILPSLEKAAGKLLGE
jgi:hypothetical protein